MRSAPATANPVISPDASWLLRPEFRLLNLMILLLPAISISFGSGEDLLIFGEKCVPKAMVARRIPRMKLMVLSGRSMSCMLTIPEGMLSIFVNAVKFSLNSRTL